MPFGDISPSLPTADWQIKVTLDDHLPSVQSRLFVLDRYMDEFGKKPEAQVDNCVYIPNVGWMLRPLMMKPGGAFEINPGQSDIFTSLSGTWALAADHEEVPLFRTEALLGVTYADSPSSGGTFFQKRIGDGVSFTQKLGSDETALPPPFPSEDNVNMDRVGKSTSDHRPGDHISFAFYVPGRPSERTTALITLYFNAGAGAWSGWAGAGIYALKCMGDGRGFLFERGRVSGDTSDTWRRVKEIKWADAMVYGAHHRITICMDAYQEGSDWFGRGMAFVTQSLPEPNSDGILTAGEAVFAIAGGNVGIFNAGAGFNNPTYTPRQDSILPITRQPIRVDVRRDIRALVQVAKSSYPDTGFVFDGIISLPTPPKVGELLNAAWYGFLPGDSSITIQIFDADTGTELAGGSASSYDGGGVVAYPVPAGYPTQRHYRVKVTANATTDNSQTPLWKNVRFFKDALIEDPDIEPLELTERTAADALPIEFPFGVLSVQQPGRTPQGQTASLTIADLGGGLDRLENRGIIPVKIDIERPSEDPITLFRGHIIEPELRQVGPDKGEDVYPAKGGRVFSCSAAGMFTQIQEQLTPQNFNWIDETVSPLPLPYKLTDIARTLLRGCLDPANIEVPDLPTRLWGKDASNILPIGTETLSYLVDLLDGYLGAYLIWDDSVGTNGKMRLLQPKAPPYTPVAAFTMQVPDDGILVSAPDAYDTITYAPTSTVLRPKPVLKNSYRSTPMKVEGTSVTVIGVPETGTGYISQCCVNVEAFKAYGTTVLDPEDPNCVGRDIPIQLFDIGLKGVDALNWMARRIYEVACVPRRRLTIAAPSQLIMDPEDASQVRPRPLRFYDPVVFVHSDGTQELYLVLDNVTSGSKAYNMVDRLTLVSADAFWVGSQFQGAMPKLRDRIEVQRRIISRMIGFPTSLEPFVLSKGREQINSLGVIPSQLIDPIQDLDPASGTYGEFL